MKMRDFMVSKKRLHYLCEDGIEKSVPRNRHLLSLSKPPDAKWRSSEQIFLCHHHTHDGFL